MKVLIIDNSIDNTGASNALFKTITGLPPGKFTCSFVFPRGSHCVPTAESLGFKTYQIPMLEVSRRISDLIRYLPRLLSNAVRLRKIIRKEGICIVECNDLYNMLGLSLKLISGVKVITHVRRMPESFPATIYRIWVGLHQRFADKILPVSAANQRIFRSSDKIEVVYDPLPDAELYPAYVPRAQLNRKVSILYLANYTDGKGHLHALKVLALAVQRLPEWTFSLHFYGGNFGLEKNNEYRDSLEKYALENELTSYVKFSGQTRDVEQIMKTYDIVFNLSDSESFSRVTLEALFFGLPTLATDVGGTNEMIMDGHTGVLASAKNIENMYQGLEKILLDDALRIRMSAQAYNFVRDRFGWERTVAPIVRAYQELSTLRN